MKLREFAEKLGLSPTTVSRALAGYPEVGLKTRQRILQEAALHGYRPNGTAVGLATGKAGTIAVIFDRAMQSLSIEFLTGVAEALVRVGSEMAIAPLASSPEENDVEVCGRLVKSGRIDAAILCAPANGDGRVGLLLDQDLPFLLYGRSLGWPVHAWFDIDEAELARRATEHLLGLAHRRIAMISGPADRSFSTERDSGYRRALANHAVSYDPAIVANGDLSEGNAFTLAQALLKLPRRPTAIVTGTTESAFGVYRAARSHGLIVGRDLSVVAHDYRLVSMRAEHMSPALTSTRSSLRHAAIHAGKLVLELIAGRPAHTVHESWRADFVIGNSSCLNR